MGPKSDHQCGPCRKSFVTARGLKLHKIKVPRPPNPTIPVSWVEALTRAFRLNQRGITWSSQTMCPAIIESRADWQSSTRFKIQGTVWNTSYIFDESGRNCDGPLSYNHMVFDTRMISWKIVTLESVIVTPHRLLRFLLRKINLRRWVRYCIKVASPFSGGHIII